MKIPSMLALLFFLGCITPFSQKILLLESQSPAATGSVKIAHKISGDLLIFGLIPVGPTPDIKQALLRTAAEYNCQELKNIEMEYYNHSYLLVSFPRLLIQADCVVRPPG